MKAQPTFWSRVKVREMELLRKLVDAILKTDVPHIIEEPYPYALGYYEVACQNLIIENESLKDTIERLREQMRNLEFVVERFQEHCD